MASQRLGQNGGTAQEDNQRAWVTLLDSLEGEQTGETSLKNDDEGRTPLKASGNDGTTLEVRQASEQETSDRATELGPCDRAAGVETGNTREAGGRHTATGDCCSTTGTGDGGSTGTEDCCSTGTGNSSISESVDCCSRGTGDCGRGLADLGAGRRLEGGRLAHSGSGAGRR